MQPPKGFLAWLAGLSVLGFLATDMYLPAFATMQQELNSSPGEISASLSLFLAGFAIAQLAWGPLSDRFGRRPILLTGLTLFATGCLGILWIETAKELLVLRFVQAVGVCAATVSWQALVADRYPASQANRIFATIMPLVALSPALAPLLGSWLLVHFDWRAIFLVLFAITLILMLPALTLRTAAGKRGNRPASTIRYPTLLKHPEYRGNVLIYAACSASFFAWLTGSPFLLHDLGYGPAVTGLSYVPQTIAFLVGGYGCRSVLLRVSGDKLLPWLLSVYAIGVFWTLGVTLSGHATLTLLLIPFCIVAVANGAIYPIAVAAALRPFSQAAGRAAALQNTLQLGLCFAASLLVSSGVEHAMLTTTEVMGCTVILAFWGYKMRRSGKYCEIKRKPDSI